MPRITDYNNFKDPGAEESERGYQYDTADIHPNMDLLYCNDCGQCMHTWVDASFSDTDSLIVLCPPCAKAG